MKKRPLLRHMAILLLVFLAALLISALFTGRRSHRPTQAMAAPTLPRVGFLVGEETTNFLPGYRVEMDLATMRDTVTPVYDDRVSMVLERNDNDISQISYAVYTADGQQALLRGTGEEINGVVELAFGDALSPQQEALLQVTLTFGGEEAHYYTRIVSAPDFATSGCLDFARRFHENALAGNSAAVADYLEPGAASDNTTFQTVNIHSNPYHITWGDLEPQTVTEPQWEITETNGSYTSVLASYQVSLSGEGGAQIFCNVQEFFRVRLFQNTYYLLDYERTASQVFTGEGSPVSDNALRLGLADPSLSYESSDGSQAVSFVLGGDLWSYQPDRDTLARIFSFSSPGETDPRNLNDRYQVRILHVAADGSTTFSVTGYINRGAHEGYAGTGLFYYDAGTDTVEEKAFLPTTSGYILAREDAGRLFFYSQPQDTLYTLSGGSLLRIRLRDNSQRTLAEDLAPGSYVTSPEGQRMAYQRGEDIQILNLYTGDSRRIQGKEGETLVPLGFLGEDFLYGVTAQENRGTTASGRELLPMSRLEIQSPQGELLMTYTEADRYVTGVVLEDDLVTVSLARRQGDTYIASGTDYITRSTPEEAAEITLESYSTETLETQMELVFPQEIADPEPRILRPMLTADSTPLVLPEAEEAGDTFAFYVYGLGRLLGVYDQASYAISVADQAGGVVTLAHQVLLWEAENRAVSVDLGIPPFRADGRTTLEACLDYLEEAETAPVDLTGCTLEQILYVLGEGHPVIALTENQEAVLLTAFDTDTITFIDPRSDAATILPRSQMEERLQAGGNTFIAGI